MFEWHVQPNEFGWMVVQHVQLNTSLTWQAVPSKRDIGQQIAVHR